MWKLGANPTKVYFFTSVFFVKLGYCIEGFFSFVSFSNALSQQQESESKVRLYWLQEMGENYTGLVLTNCAVMSVEMRVPSDAFLLHSQYRSAEWA
jgi:hypothetical protein